VVVVGLTACVPPLGCSGYVLLSVPVIVTRVAFAATTVNVDEFPETIEVGLATMVTVGAGFVAAVTVTVALAEALPPVPVAAAVYVVVVVGLTACVPPLGCSG
jgi:ABC-type methionine transport system permease subunit